jgi:hypothetical protein
MAVVDDTLAMHSVLRREDEKESPPSINGFSILRAVVHELEETGRHFQSLE